MSPSVSVGHGPELTLDVAVVLVLDAPPLADPLDAVALAPPAPPTEPLEDVVLASAPPTEPLDAPPPLPLPLVPTVML